MSSARILVVDDNPSNLKLICAMLKFSGYEVVTVMDGEGAQALLDSGDQFDLILMDVLLPGIDGLELTRRLKTNAATRHIPIAILTASAMKGDDKRALASGANSYFTKPINTRTFPLEVAKLLAS
jgi:CheY-like chemotaxis protein